MNNLTVNINKIGKIFNLFKLKYILVFFIFSFHSPKVNCQESKSQNQSFEANISIPFFIQSTNVIKTIKGKPQPDKITKRPKSPFLFIIKAKTINAQICNNRITAHYENFEGKEKIDFSGIISKDKKMLLKLGINYSYIIEKDYTEIRKGKFYIYNIPLSKVDKRWGKDLYRIKNIAENEEIFMGKHDVDTTKIEVESYLYYNNSLAIGTYHTETLTEILVGDDTDYYKKVLPFGYLVAFTSSEENVTQGIVFKGNSASYAGYVIEGLLKQQKIQIFDQTDEINKVRQVEASMKDICQPNHRELALNIEENLKTPTEGKTTVTINETRNSSPQGISTVVTIKGPKSIKELRYTLDFGESDSDLITSDELFFSQIEEIVDAIIQLK
mgnify:CR=1 FL=1